MFSIAICDDQREICSEIENIILDYQKSTRQEMQIEEFYSAEKLGIYMEYEHNFDLIFLDIEMDKILLGQQNKYYQKQFELMESSLKTTKAMRHDLRNHLSVIYALIDKGERDAALKHLAKMTDVYDDKKQYACSENIDIDSILNFKIQEAERQNIKVALDLSVPAKMSIASFDLAIILGNLLDNAIEAVAELEKERQIKTNINYDKGRLIILVENPYQGERVKDGNRYLSTNKELSQHGLGLENVKSVLQKYDGSMDINQRSNIFSVSLLLFV